MCVCLSVCEHSDGWTVWHIIKKFSTGIDFDYILYEFDGQGHRSKVKVTRSKKRDFQHFQVRVPVYKTLVSSMFMCIISHMHTCNITKCARAQIGSACGRCSNTVVFLCILLGRFCQDLHDQSKSRQYIILFKMTGWLSMCSSVKHYIGL